MGDPHDRSRYGEVWLQHRIDAGLAALARLRELVVLSGGWAWHFMSPPGHVELRHAHDHKDIDVFVPRRDVAATMGVLTAQGFAKVRTRYDRLPSDEEFRRYEKIVDDGERPPFRVTIDFFVGDHPTRTLAGGWRVVEPATLLGFYRDIHSSDKCFAVQAAARLIEQGIDPVGRPELVAIPDPPA